MVIVQLSGGLGNQLFQYAYGKSLATRNKCRLKLDLSMFEFDTKRDYSLMPFKIEAELASKRECNLLKGQNLNFFDSIIKKIFFSKSKIIIESNFYFCPENIEIKPPAFLIGYWQTEKYFKEFRHCILNNFQIFIPASLANQAMICKIESCNSISLHVRRGDFINENSTNKTHGVCSIEYYKKAIDFIAKKISNPVFFIFSDDTKWVYENMKLHFSSFVVDINDHKFAYEDLRLMSKCKHHILANSSLSWWGAWLNESENKVVIAPKIWFADLELNNATSDLCPEEWIRM